MSRSFDETFSFIEDDVLRASWQRCALTRAMTDQVEFAPLTAEEVSTSLELNADLVRGFKLALHNVGSGLTARGFYPVLTDARSMILAHVGDDFALATAQRRALLTGTDMSERAIGTAGMNCALIAGRPVQVIAGEHFLLGNAHVQCAAAPTYSGDGRLIGAINLAKFVPGKVFGALETARDIAQRIEIFLLRQLKGHLIFLGARGFAGICVGEDGELRGLTQSARELLGLTGAFEPPARFEDLFDVRFPDAMSAMRARQSIELVLASGAVLECRSEDLPKPLACPRPTRELDARGLGDRGGQSELLVAKQALGQGLAILLRGETGTGKEVLARALHDSSAHRSGPFVAVNCAALPESLIESELFGYADGAFTGGRKGGAPGRAEEAQGGTLFLDEIGDMTAALQSRLLRLLDRREVSRLGSGKLVKLDFQLVCATHRDLEAMMREGTFRADLFYRINGYSCRLSPLRERPDRVELFLELVETVCQHRPGIDESGMAFLNAQPWPGNVREALAVLRRSLLFTGPHTPINASALERATQSGAQPVPSNGYAPVFKPLPAAPQEMVEINADPASPGDLALPLCDVEDRAISHALRNTRGNVVRAAQLLGVSRSTLQRRIKERPMLHRALREARVRQSQR